jgi:hypothetical protein
VLRRPVEIATQSGQTGWGTDELIETDDGEVTDGGHQDVAIDGDGNAIAVWHQFDGSSNSIYANRLQ